MYKDPYLILQVSEDAPEREIDAAYDRLKRQYTEQMFLPGLAGDEAARKLTKLEEAYREIKSRLESKRARPTTAAARRDEEKISRTR